MTTFASVVLPSDASNTGKPVRNVTTNDGAGTVYGQVVSVADPQSANVAAVKAASTAATATDPAFVVALSPNTEGTIRSLNVSTTGTITANDANLGAPSTTGSGISGAATAGSTVFLLLKGGENQFSFQLSGSNVSNVPYYFPEFSPDTTTGADGLWYSLYFRQRGVPPGSGGTVNNGFDTLTNYEVSSTGFHTGDLPPCKGIRIRLAGGGTALGGTSNVLLSAGTSLSLGNVQDPNLGSKGESGATNDNGSFSLLALTKRLLGKFPSAIGATTSAASLSTVLATDQAGIIDSNVTGAGSQLAAGQNVILATAGAGWFDTASFRSSGLAIIPAAGTVTAGTVVFEGSNDTVNTVPVLLYDEAAPSAAPVSTYNVVASTPRFFSGPLKYRYIRARISVALTGTTTGLQAYSIFRAQPFVPPTIVLGTGTAATMVGGFNALQWGSAAVTAAAAFANAQANPTAPAMGAYQKVYNGATWDNGYGNWNTTTGDTGAKTATFNGATQTNFNNRGAAIAIIVSAVSGTTPTLTAQVQYSPDNGTTFINLPGAVTASITAVGTYPLMIYPGVTAAANAAINSPLPRTWRIVYTIGGTTPSFTITSVLVSYQV